VTKFDEVFSGYQPLQGSDPWWWWPRRSLKHRFHTDTWCSW